MDFWQYQLSVSFSCWWLLCLLAVFLWYRNNSYDRIFAPIILLLGVIQLCVFGVYSGGNMNQGGIAIYLAMWIQPLILAIGMYSYFYNTNELYRRISGWFLLLTGLIFAIAVVALCYCNIDYRCRPTNMGDIWEAMTTRETTSMFYYWGWLYILLIVIGLLILLAFHDWKDLTIIFLLFSVVGLAVAVKFSNGVLVSGYIFCLIAFLLWIMGIGITN